MKYVIKASEAVAQEEHGVSTFHDYQFPFSTASLGISEIHARYPQSGFDVDKEVDAYWYVEEGEADIFIGEEVRHAGKHDMLFIPKGEKYYIDTKGIRLVVCSMPSWYPQQHQHLEG